MTYSISLSKVSLIKEHSQQLRTMSEGQLGRLLGEEGGKRVSVDDGGASGRFKGQGTKQGEIL